VYLEHGGLSRAHDTAHTQSWHTDTQTHYAVTAVVGGSTVTRRQIALLLPDHSRTSAPTGDSANYTSQLSPL
jgi:hypothetical protein